VLLVAFDFGADVFEFGVVQDSVMGTFSAKARFLYTSKRSDLGGDESGVVAHDAVFERFRDSPDAVTVASI
jgi:hypothetical protein